MPTILELFKGKEKDTAVKAEKETLIEQETSGIRIRSAVEVNNPLIYGNEAARITLRSTAISDEMKQAANGSQGDGGLIGKGLSKITGGNVTSLQGLRTKANTFLQDKLGVPVTAIPTRIIGKIQGDSKHNSLIEINSDWFGGEGRLPGTLLKGAGGNPKTILRQAAGKGIGLAKDKLRGALFGTPTSIGSVEPDEPKVIQYSSDDTLTYSGQAKDSNRKSFSEKEDFEKTKLDLTLVSPIYGVRRPGSTKYGTPEGQFGKGEYGYVAKSASLPQANYSPVEGQNYSKIQKDVEGRSKTLTERGLTTYGDVINMGNPYNTTIGENGTGTTKDTVTVDGFGPVNDLIPLFIGRYGSTTYPKMAFRCAIGGLTETTSPSWSSNNFVGNPYKYYIFETVERSVSFNLQIYCMNPVELANNWSKLTNLTKLAYPLVENNMAHPNFIEFTLGDMYRDKACIMESLSYTFPDNGTWETDIEGLLLPKFVDVAITLKFVETIENGSVRELYAYPKSGSAADITSQHKLYENASNIEYYTTDNDGNLKLGSKTTFKDDTAAGKKRTVKIKIE